MKIISKMWVTFGFLMMLFGIFWLPRDLGDWKDAALPWKRLASMVDQNAALWIFAIITLSYIAWIDIRPLLRKPRLKTIDVDGVGKAYLLNEAIIDLVRDVRDGKNHKAFNLGYFNLKEMTELFEVCVRSACAKGEIGIYGKRIGSVFHEKISGFDWEQSLYIEASGNIAKKNVLGKTFKNFDELVIPEKDLKKLRRVVKTAKEFPKIFRSQQS